MESFPYQLAAEKWYQACHGERLVSLLREIGVDMVWVHFYKGFGLRAEQREMRETAHFIDLCHRYQLRVLNYLQFGSIMYETMSLEEPESRDWVARDVEGRPITYFSQYWRHWPCPNSFGFLSYLKRVIKKGFEIGGDGLWVDNIDMLRNGCYCYRCAQRFREYLEGAFPEEEQQNLFGLQTFRAVMPPPTLNYSDPVCQEWIRFKCLSITRAFAELADYAREVKPGAIIGSNPGFPRYNEAVDLSMDIASFARANDLIFIEHDNFTRITKSARLVTQVRAYKYGNALGRMMAPYVWYTLGPEDPAAPSSPMGAFRRAEIPPLREYLLANYAEPSAFGGHAIGGAYPALPWRGENPLIESEDFRKMVKEFSDFREKFEELYLGTESGATVAVLESFPSLVYNWDGSFPSALGFEQVLLQGHIPFDIVLDDQLDNLSRYSVLVLPNACLLSDGQLSSIKSFVGEGGGIVMTGGSSLCDERFRKRDDYGLAELLVNRVSGAPRDGLRCVWGKGRIVFYSDLPESSEIWEKENDRRFLAVQLPLRSKELLDQVQWAGATRIPVRLEAPRTLACDLFKQGDRMMLHLINYDTVNPAEDVAVTVTLPKQKAAHRVALLAPELEVAVDLEWESDGDQLRCSVPRVDIYAVAVFHLHREGS